MFKQLAVVLCLILFGSSNAYALKIGEVELPDTIAVHQQNLLLNGAGLRKKFIIKVYAAGLYLNQKRNAPVDIINTDEPMMLRMHFIYDGISAEKLVETWNEGFSKATGGNTGAIHNAIEQFNSLFTEETKKGDIYDLAYTPGHGTDVSIKGQLKGTIPGLEFKQALFGIWLGDKPADSALQKDLLGK